MHHNPINLKKIAGSKWTAVSPSGREKHFLVLDWSRMSDGTRSSELVDLEAVLTRRVRSIPWRELADSAHWKIGWW